MFLNKAVGGKKKGSSPPESPSSTREPACLEGTGFLRFDVNNTGYGWTEFRGNEWMPRQAIQLFDI